MWLAHIHDMVRVYRGITKKAKIIRHHAMAYLCKVAPVAKFKCALYIIIQILDIGSVVMKGKPC